MSSFKEGFDCFIRVNGANLGSSAGDLFVTDVNAEISKLINTLNDSPMKNLDTDFLKGFAAEDWHEGTFNINAVLQGKSTRAFAPRDTGRVDITVDDLEAQLKYYKTGKDSAKQQLDYLGQQRIIPADQMREARDWLQRKIDKESVNRPELVHRYQDTLDNLTDKLESDGIESITLDEDVSKKLARAMREDGVDPAEFNLVTEGLVKFDHIMNQAFKAGLTAALVSVVLQVGPQICGILCRMIKNEEIETDDFKRLGFSALNGSAEGFVRGTIAAAVTVSCKSGLLGATLKSVNPSVIGAVVAITMNCVQNSCLLAYGSISKQEYADRCAQDLIVTAFSVGLGAIAALNPFMPVIGFMIGSLVGSVVGTFVYKGVYSCTMAFCVESGCTFFGIVEQNYELPSDVLDSMGVEVFEYEKIELHKFSPESISVKTFEYDKFEPIGIDIKYLRRGVIGVGIVGYI